MSFNLVSVDLDEDEFSAAEHIQTRTLDFAYPGSGWMTSPTWSGIGSNEQTALQIESLVCGLRCISEDVAKMPLYVYDCDEKDNLSKDKDNALYHLLLSEPNPSQTKFAFLKEMIVYGFLYGYSVAEIVRNGKGDVVELWAVHPHYCRIYRNQQTGTLVYQDTRIYSGGPPRLGTEYLDASDVLHFNFNVSYQGEVGLGLLHLARNLVGNCMAMMRYEGSVWKNAPKMKGYVYESERVTNSLQAMDNTTESFKKQADKEDVGDVAYLKFPLKFEALDMSNPEQVQLAQLKAMYATQWAKWLRLSPIKIMEYGRSTWGNMTEVNRQHWDETISPIAVMIEEELQKKLLTPILKKKKRIRFDPSVLLRGDPLTQAQVNQIAVAQPYKTPNEARAELGYPQLDDPVADQLPQQQDTNDASPDTDPADDESDGGNNGNPPSALPKNFNDGGNQDLQ